MKIWAELDESVCPCSGNGWGLISDEWQECPLHFCGQLHPESKDLLLDDLKQLADAEKTSILNWKINKQRNKLAELQTEVSKAQLDLHLLELELTNRTPTTKIQVIPLNKNCYPTVKMKAVRPEEK